MLFEGVSNIEQTSRYHALTLLAASGDSDDASSHDLNSIFRTDLEQTMRYPDWQEPVLDALIEQSLAKMRAAAEVIEAKIAESPKVGVEYAALLDAERVLSVVKQRREAANLHCVLRTR